MYQRILAAVDGSEAGAPALRTALALAAEQPAQLRLVHVVDEVASSVINEPMVNIEAVDDAWSAAGKKVLDAAAAEARAAGITADAALLQRSRQECADAIIDEAEQWGADLIIVGTHGRRRVKRLLLGSVAEGVARRSRVPVLLVRAT